MLKVLRPSKNKQTQGYSEKHKAYDFDDIPDKNYYSSLYGTVVQAKNSETKTWRNTGKLTTNDYGNYIKIKGEIDGKTYYQLGAHFQPGTVLPKGTEVKRGQVVAQAGKTGNCQPVGGGDGSHSHTEYRNGDSKNIPVAFVENGTEVKEVKEDMQSKEQIIIDAYFAITGEYPSDDAKAARLQKNENTAELIYDLLNADAKSKPRWLEIWGVKEVKDETAENYKQTIEDIKEILRPVGIKMGDLTEVVKAKITEIVDIVKDSEEEEKPKPKIEKDVEHIGDINIFGFIIRFLLKRGDTDAKKS